MFVLYIIICHPTLFCMDHFENQQVVECVIHARKINMFNIGPYVWSDIMYNINMY